MTIQPFGKHDVALELDYFLYGYWKAQGDADELIECIEYHRAWQLGVPTHIQQRMATIETLLRQLRNECEIGLNELENYTGKTRGMPS